MRQLNKKGFLLLDSLITVFITSLVCITCYSIYHLIISYDDGYLKYQERSNNELEYIYNNTYECEACIIDEFN